MSRRIQYKSTITNHALLKKTLDTLGWRYEEEGFVITLLSGPAERATINFNTGEIVGDTDWLRKKSLNPLLQAYSEQEVIEKAYMQGATIESREEDKQGNVVILCRLFG